MAGHSKWANIQHRKGAQDKKRAKIFTKLIREVTVAAKLVERAIKRGSGDMEGVNYEEVRYEGYGPGGVAVMVDCMTDNRNRTVADVRHAFSKFGGNLGADGSVSYLFSQVGLIGFGVGADEERIMEAALEAGAEDVVSHEDGSIEVLTDPTEFESVRNAMAAADLEPEAAEVTMRASTSTVLGEDEAGSMVKLLDVLEDLDDVWRGCESVMNRAPGVGGI
jgi:YebC/PmpR family DNA-binding regulatory protein